MALPFLLLPLIYFLTPVLVNFRGNKTFLVCLSDHHPIVYDNNVVTSEQKLIFMDGGRVVDWAERNEWEG